MRFPGRVAQFRQVSLREPAPGPGRETALAARAIHNSAAVSPVFGPFHSSQRNQIVEERHRYRSIILFGMPGSGKGTQGAVLGQLPDWIHISMGDVFRKIPRNGKFGREIEQYTSQGGWFPTT